MNVLVLNAGSSSLKYQLINVETHEVLAKGICERVGSAEAFHKHGIDENEVVIDTPCPAIANALENACGVRIREMPITAEKVWRELNRR